MTGATTSSLTDLLATAFRDVLVPLAVSGGQDRLDFAAKPRDGSYFRIPTRPTLSRADMEATGRSGELEALAALWRSQGRNGLLELIPLLEAIAARLEVEATEERKSDALSTLIYQMY